MLPWILACAGPDENSPETSTPGDSAPGTPKVRFIGEPPKNLIFITLDTTRRDFVGRYSGGSGSSRTPNLDRFLSEAVVLDDHRTCSNWTGPSMSCVTTGATPFEQGWWPWSTDPLIPGALDRLPTLASLLQDQSWLTTVVTGNEVFGWDLNLNRGFDTFVNPEFKPADVVAEAALVEAADLVDSLVPYYLHVHFIDPHSTYCPPPSYVNLDGYVNLGVDVCPDAGTAAAALYPNRSAEWQQQFVHDVRAYYGGELAYWDTLFGQFLDDLDAMGALDDSLVVFATDHGEQLLERGDIGHGSALGSEENRAVAAFWARNLPPTAWEGPTVHQDVAATIADIYGLPLERTSGIVVGMAPTDRVVRGMNFWAGPGAYWDTTGAQLSVVQHGNQLTYDWWGERHLYRLAEDPAGLDDRYGADDPDVRALWVPMTEFLDEIASSWDHLDAPVAPGP